MITAEEFIRVWQNAETMKQVTDTLGITQGYASSRASRFRKAGVPLKYFSRASIGYNWDDLAMLAEQLGEGE